MPQEFQRVTQRQNPSPESSEEDRESHSSDIRRTTLEQDTLSQAVVRIVNEAARDQEGNGDAGGSRTPQSEGDQEREISQARGKQQDCDSVEQHSSVQDPGAQTQSNQKRTRDQQACLRRYQQRP